MTEYLSLDAVFAALKKQHSEYLLNLVLHVLNYEDDKTHHVRKEFKELLHQGGFRKVKFLSQIGTDKDRGQCAIILESTDGLLARLTFQREGYEEISHYAILSPLKILHGKPLDFRGEVFRPRIDVMPYVPLPSTPKETLSVMNALVRDGIFVRDSMIPANVRVFEYEGKRVPVLIDRDLHEKTGYSSRWHYKLSCERHGITPPRFNRNVWIDPETGIWKQKLWEPRILTGETGTFPEKELAEYAAKHPNSSVVAAIREGELYVGELHNLLAEDGASKYDPKNQTRFEARLKNAASLLKGKSPSK